jgi:hypothetical protein
MTVAESNVVWCYSDQKNPDSWPNHADTREQAIEMGRETYGHDVTFWIAMGHRQGASGIALDADGYIENMRDHAAEECEDGAEFVEVKPGGKEALDALLATWLAQYVEVTYWIVDGEQVQID